MQQQARRSEVFRERKDSLGQPMLFLQKRGRLRRVRRRPVLLSHPEPSLYRSDHAFGGTELGHHHGQLGASGRLLLHRGERSLVLD